MLTSEQKSHIQRMQSQIERLESKKRLTPQEQQILKKLKSDLKQYRERVLATLLAPSHPAPPVIAPPTRTHAEKKGIGLEAAIEQAKQEKVMFEFIGGDVSSNKEGIFLPWVHPSVELPDKRPSGKQVPSVVSHFQFLHLLQKNGGQNPVFIEGTEYGYIPDRKPVFLENGMNAYSAEGQQFLYNHPESFQYFNETDRVFLTAYKHLTGVHDRTLWERTKELVHDPNSMLKLVDQFCKKYNVPSNIKTSFAIASDKTPIISFDGNNAFPITLVKNDLEKCMLAYNIFDANNIEREIEFIKRLMKEQNNNPPVTGVGIFGIGHTGAMEKKALESGLKLRMLVSPELIPEFEKWRNVGSFVEEYNFIPGVLKEIEQCLSFIKERKLI